MTAPARDAGPSGRTRTKTTPKKAGSKTAVSKTAASKTAVSKTAAGTSALPGTRERGTGRSPAAQPDRVAGRGRSAVLPDRVGGGRSAVEQSDRVARGRSAAAERAFARRAQRTGQPAGAQPERRPGSAGRVTFVILVIVLLIGGVVTTLWFSTQATADAYRLEQAKNTTNQLQVSVGQLQQQVARQDSPQWLGQQAHRLGMIPAGDPAHLVVGANGRVSVIGTPSAAQPPPPPPKPTTAAPSSTAQPPAANKTANKTTSTTPAGG